MRSEGDSRRVHGIATRLPRKALPLAFGTLVGCGECVRLRSPSDGRPGMFAVVCQHCHATVLTTPRIRRSEEDQLAAHFETRHPRMDYNRPDLGMLLLHFSVRPTPPDGAVNPYSSG